MTEQQQAVVYIAIVFIALLIAKYSDITEGM
jgi:hypothetical protein